MRDLPDPSTQNCCQNFKHGLACHLDGREMWPQALSYYEHAARGNHASATTYMSWIRNNQAVKLPVDFFEISEDFIGKCKDAFSWKDSSIERGMMIASEYSAYFKPPVDSLWHTAKMCNDVQAIGASFAELQGSLARIGPVHNVMDGNGIPIAGCIREIDPKEEEGWWTIDQIEIAGGVPTITGNLSNPLPPLVTQADVNVAIWLAYFERDKPAPPSFSLDRAGDGRTPRRLDRKTFNPTWLAATPYGQSMYAADWLMKSFTMRDGLPSLTDPCTSGAMVEGWNVPSFLDKFGSTGGDYSLSDGRVAEGGRLEIVVRGVSVSRAHFRRWLRRMVQYRIDAIDLFVESSLMEYVSDGVDSYKNRNHYRHDDPSTGPGAGAKLITDNYSYVSALFPVFGRVRLLLALFSVFSQARRDGVIISSSVRENIKKEVTVYKRILSTEIPAVEYSPKPFHKGGCYCSGGVSGRDHAAVVNTQSRPFADQGKRVHATYVKVHEITKEVYSGRTSGFGDPSKLVRSRDLHHHVNEHGFGPAVLDVYSTNYAAVRGREEALIQRHGGPQRYGGVSGNRYSGINDRHKMRVYYLAEAAREFGDL